MGRVDPEMYGVPEASRASGIAEQELLRQIAAGELAATRGDTPKGYFIRGGDLGLPDRPRKPIVTRRRKIIVLTLVIVNLAFLGSCTLYTMRYGCTTCGRLRTSNEFILLGSSATFRSTFEDTELTPWLTTAPVDACRHNWVFWNGSGGGAI